MKISRQVGTQSQILNVYAQDFSVTTGAGIANIPATTVSYTWFRNNHAGASTGVGVSTASMGTYTSGAWTQINSATALGWYQFGIPNDALLSGDCAGVLLRVSTGAFNMAPIPIEIELTKTNNQQYMSSQTIGFVQNGVNMSSIVGTAAVTSAGGQLQVSTQTIDKGGYGVTTIASNITTNANVLQAYGSAIVTSAAGVLNVSTQTIATPLTSTQIIQGVWDEIGTSHTASSSFAVTLKNTAALVSTIAGTGVYILDNGITFNSFHPETWPLLGVMDAGIVGTTGAATSFTASSAVLRPAASSFANDTVIGANLYIYNVTTGAGQRRVVTDWNSTGPVANVDNWLITPGGTSASYVLFATAPISTSYLPGVDWGNVLNKGTYNNLSSTFISTNQSIAGASAPTAAQVAQAVWDEIATSHSASSSFAQVLKLGMSNVSTIMSGVNITSIVGTAAVTSAGGQLRVSTQTLATVPTTAQIAVGVWDEVTTSHTVSSTFGLAVRNMSALSSNWVTTSDVASSSQIIQGVWNELYTAYTSVSSSFGQALYNAQSASGLTSTQVAEAVWSKVNSSFSGVSTFGYLAKQITSVSAGVNVTAFSGTITTNANLLQVYGSAVVTSASGQLRVSTQTIDKTGYSVTSVSSNVYVGLDWGNVTNKAAYNDLSSTFISTNQSIAGASAPTAAQVAQAVWDEIATSHSASSSFAQVLKLGMSNVSTVLAGVNVSTIKGTATVGAPGYVGVDWGNVTNKAAYNALSSTFISTNQSIAGASAPTSAENAVAVWSEINSSYSNISTFGYLLKQVTSISASGSVNVSSIAGSPVATSGAGILTVSTQTIPTFASSSDARFAFLDVSVSSRAATADSRFANLDGSVSSRAASSDARLARLDVSVSSRATAGDAMALTSGERATLAGVILTTTQPESFRSVNAAGSLMQTQYEILANLTEFSNSGTTRTLGSVTSHALGTATYQYNSTVPSAITRTA